MYITHDENGLVTAYSDNKRNPNSLKVGEVQVEIDMEFEYIGCKEGDLTFRDGVFYRKDEILGKQVELEKENESNPNE